MEMLSRRKFLVNSLLAAGAVTLGGAAVLGARPQQAQAADTIELKYWYCWTDKIKENNEERVQEFNDSVGKDKGIHVTAEYQGSYDDLNAKLKTAYVANEEPDVCVMVINGTQAFADGGMIQPIDDLVSEDDVKDFWPGLMKNCYADDTLYGVPYLRSTPVMYYNKTLFEKAGLDPEKAPETWQDVNDACDALAKIDVAGLSFVTDWWPFTAYTYCFGGTPFGDDITAKEATFNQAPAVEMTKWFDDAVANHNFQYAGPSANSNAVDQAVMNQKAAIWVGSTAGLTNYKQIAGDNGFEINVGFIPKQTQNKVPTGGYNLVMTGRLEGDRRAAAGEFINFMTSKDAAVKNHLKTGYLLTRQSDADDERIKEAYKETPQYQVALDQLQYAVGDYMNAGYTEACKTYTEALDKIFAGDDDIQKTLDDAVAKCNPILSE